MHPPDFTKELRRGEARLLRRALGLGLIVAALLTIFGLSASDAKPRHALSQWIVAPPANVQKKPEPLVAEKLSAELRHKGYNECYTHDPIGLGPYTPYKNVRGGGRMLIPQKGGFTKDYGYDVVLHFHGHEAVRKTFVQVSRGCVFVGFDKGQGSGAYTKAFLEPAKFEAVLESVERALRHHINNEAAHIRHLALSGWSAGYGAVNEILKYHPDEVDAVILLDGLHAGWLPGGPPPRHKSAHDVTGAAIAPIIEFAERAKQGEKIFVFTHSEIDPVNYPSTELTADFLLDKLDISNHAVPRTSDPFGLTAKADQKGFHVWAYAGRDELAHCTHTAYLGNAVRDVLEPAWKTPAMDRGVPFTPAPKLNGN